MNMTTIAAFFSGLALAGCTKGQAEGDVTTSRVATFPAAPTSSDGIATASSSRTTDAEITVDVRDDLSTMASVGKLSFSLSRDSLGGTDLAFIDGISATLAAADGSLPTRALARVPVMAGAADVELSSLLSDEELLEYFAEGPVVLHITLTGRLPTRAVTLDYSLLAHVAVVVDKSVQDL